MTEGRRRLAELFEAWVSRHGYTQSQVAAMGGPSTTTQTKVVKSDDSLSRQTLRQLDAVMGWEPGTAAGVLQGRHPVEVPDPHGGNVPPVGNTDDNLLLARPHGLSDEEWGRIKAENLGYFEWLIEKASREQRGS